MDEMEYENDSRPPYDMNPIREEEDETQDQREEGKEEEDNKEDNKEDSEEGSEEEDNKEEEKEVVAAEVEKTVLKKRKSSEFEQETTQQQERKREAAFEHEHEKEGMCVECEDQPAEVRCLGCQEDFCDVCFYAQHKKGTRKDHKKEVLESAKIVPAQQIEFVKKPAIMEEDIASDDEEERKSVGEYFVERSKHIPIRLSHEERKYLQLLESALNVSEYTDKVDIFSYTSKSKRIYEQLNEICSILSGLVVASDYNVGNNLLKNKGFHENEEFFRKVFEIGRRHKIVNPEKMRTDYGKMICLLQDSRIYEIQSQLKFDLVAPIKTVYLTLKENHALDLLREDSIIPATKEITGEGKTKAEVQKELRQKEKAIEELSQKYSSPEGLSKDDIINCLSSISDNHSFLRVTRDAVDRMLVYLRENFEPTPSEGVSLAITSGVGGARLTHSHSYQYSYVEQSLTFWREMSHDFFKLWMLAEEDLLTEGNTYGLRDTGQGFHRLQQAPKVNREVHSILHRAQSKFPRWFGSSAIHLGDRDVPNALVFIDKYTQVPRILNPIVSTLDKIDKLAENPDLNDYINNSFNGVKALKMRILIDFFRHGFDGSGADNFFDAGSCIDGRLTSAWNWCSLIEKKTYFPIFLLTDFVGFDGKF